MAYWYTKHLEHLQYYKIGWLHTKYSILKTYIKNASI
jgi:hypothetical protein